MHATREASRSHQNTSCTSNKALEASDKNGGATNRRWERDNEGEGVVGNGLGEHPSNALNRTKDLQESLKPLDPKIQWLDGNYSLKWVGEGADKSI